MKLVHATCVLIDGLGLLLRGPSGSGKSDLALRLIARGARLVGDDYVYVGSDAVGSDVGGADVGGVGKAGSGKGWLYAAAPLEILGRIEVRGAGILKVPYKPVCRIIAVIDLVGADARKNIERLPPPAEIVIDGTPLAAFELDPFEAAAVEKAFAMARLAVTASTVLGVG